MTTHQRQTANAQQAHRRRLGDGQASDADRFLACADLDVPKLLEQMPVSRRFLEKRFKSETGRTLLQHIMETRIGRARQLIAHTDLAFSRIATLSGFGSPARFSAVFRQKTGLTPSEFRDASARGAV